MSGIAAVIRLDGSPISGVELSEMLPVLAVSGPDGTSATILGPAALACARFDTLPEDGPQPVTINAVTVVADARIDNRSELERQLSLSETCSDATIVAAVVAKWGDEAPEHLEGDFAVIAWLAHEQKLLAFRDRFGIRPLFLAEARGLLLLASSVDALLAHGAISSDFNPDYFISYFATRRVVTELTPYKAVRRLERATVLSVLAPGRKWISNYYRLRPPTVDVSLPDAAEAVRGLLERAVKVRLRANKISCEVSGGMDSTSVFALARRHRPDLEARSMVSDRLPNMDERRYNHGLIGKSPWKQIRVEDHLSLHEFNAAHLFNEPVQELLLGGVRQVFYEPFEHVQLTGHGGDALMTARYGLVRSQTRNWQFIQGWRDLRSWGDSRDRPISSVLGNALRRSMLQAGKVSWATGKARRLARTFVHELRLRDFSASPTPEVSVFNLYNETGLSAPLLPVEMRCPFLDRSLVEYSLGLEPKLKSCGPMDKVVLRRAMAGDLPSKIIDRVQKTAFDGLHSLSVSVNWPVIDLWLQRPVLAELNVLLPEGLRFMAVGLRDGRRKGFADAMIALSAEAWLQSRMPDTEAHYQRQLAEEKFSLEMRDGR